MGELRRNPVNGRWVIVAPERGRRPRTAPMRLPASGPLRSLDPTCPFCPGNEASLPGIIAEMPWDQDPGWRTRVIPNKYPAVGPGAGSRARPGGLYETVAACGSHEVLIESPRHDRDMRCMSTEEVRDVIATCLERYRALMAQATVQSVIVFRNRGEEAGASLPHPHSQIMALDMVPSLVQAREALMFDHHLTTGRCLICDIIAHEKKDGSRVIAQNDAFVALVPFAASAPCETWILPKRHQPDFGNLHAGQIHLMAVVQRDALLRIARSLGDVPYNYAINTASKGGSEAPQLHWFLQIVPQMAVPGGFELGSDIPINPSLPEEDAEMLRASLPAMMELKA